jgi:hypothetical protein
VRGIVECAVREVHTTLDERSYALDEEQDLDLDREAQFTPGQFFREAGIIMAICLGLILLTQILAAMLS